MLMEPQDPAYWRERHPDLNPSQVEKYYDKILADMGAFDSRREHWLPHSVWKQLPASADGKCRPADPQPHIAIKLPYSESEVGQVTKGSGGVKRQTCAFDGDGFWDRGEGPRRPSISSTWRPCSTKARPSATCARSTRILRDRNGSAAVRGAFSGLRERKEETDPHQASHSCCRNDEHVEAAVCQQFKPVDSDRCRPLGAPLAATGI